jgi:acyl-CoA synthetase (AMP-forming)/AMP-acid ligase II/acyl carrier protein
MDKIAGSSVSTWIEVLEARANNTPDAVAFSFLPDGDTCNAPSLTYAALAQRARVLADHIRARIAPGSVVLQLYPAGLDFVTAFFASIYAGTIAVPLYAPHKRRADLLARIAENADAALVMTTAANCTPKAMEILPNLPWLASDQLDLGGEGAVPRAATPTSPIYLQYTSGSTSSPKGVVIRHDRSMAQIRGDKLAWPTTGPDALVSWLPHFHDFGLVFGILQPLYRGMPAHLMSPAAFVQQPSRWLRAISRHRATMAGCPNFGFAHCVDRVRADELTDLDLSSWQIAPNGAEPVRGATLDAFTAKFAPFGFRAATHHPSYGLAETTLRVTSKSWTAGTAALTVDLGALAENRVVPVGESRAGAGVVVNCGAPVNGTEIRIIDPASSQAIVAGVGEIWIRGDTVASDYWRDPVATERSLRGRIDGKGPAFLRTGDLGFVRDGDLYVTGRIKELIIVRGANHYPQDLELTAQTSHPLLAGRRAAAFAIEGGQGDGLVLLIEADGAEGAAFPHAQIAGAAVAAIFRQHDLSIGDLRCVPVDTIPVTSSGKIQRGKCREMYLSGLYDRDPVSGILALGPRRRQEAEPPPERRMVARIAVAVADWAQAVQAPSSQALDLSLPVAACGFTSVETMELHMLIEETASLTIDPEMVWDAVSLSQLIADVARLAAAQARSAA